MVAHGEGWDRDRDEVREGEDCFPPWQGWVQCYSNNSTTSLQHASENKKYQVHSKGSLQRARLPLKKLMHTVHMTKCYTHSVAL